MIFDGRAFAKEIELELMEIARGLAVKPKIVSLIAGDDPASALYTRLKKAAAERVGIDFEALELDSQQLSVSNIQQKIRETGERAVVTGVMVQLPLPGVSRKDALEILKAIPLEKDVDGLRWEESGILPATVRAVLTILEEIARRKSSEHSLEQGSKLWNRKFVVLGARGAVGRPLVHALKARGVDVSGVEWDTPEPEKLVKEAQVVISCVGKAGLVTGEMVRDGVIAIDVGMSEVDGKVVGDMTQEVYAKCSMVVPVPGGVGPVTIASLIRNALEMSGNSKGAK